MSLILQKKYRKIKQYFDENEIAWANEQDVGSNFFQWNLLQEAMISSEVVRIFSQMKKDVLKAYDEKINDLVLKSLRIDFAKANTVIKRITTEDNRLIKDMSLPTTFYRKKIPASLKGWFRKSGKDPLVEIVDPIVGRELTSVFNKNTHDAAVMGGQQALYEFNVAINFLRLNQHTIDWGKNYNLVLAGKVTKTLAENIKFEILEGLQNFEGIPEIRDRILMKFDQPITVKVPERFKPDGSVAQKAYSYDISPDRWATMVARSEAIRWSANGRVEGYKQTGVVESVTLTTVGDHRTCEICEAASGEVYMLEEAQGVLPLHCLGRCTWSPNVRKEYTSKDKDLIDEMANKNIKELYS